MPQPLLQEANALLALARNATAIGGAAIAGFVVAASAPAVAIAFDAATFLAAAGIVALMRLERVPRAEAHSFFSELATGWHEFRSRTWLWLIVLQFSLLLAVDIGAFSVLGPVVADEELGGREGVGCDPDRPGGRLRRGRSDRPPLPPPADARSSRRSRCC